MKSGPEAAELFAEAEQRLLRAAELGSELTPWVLADLYASQGNEDACRGWLLKAREVGFLEPGDRPLVEKYRPFARF